MFDLAVVALASAICGSEVRPESVHFSRGNQVVQAVVASHRVYLRIADPGDHVATAAYLDHHQLFRCWNMPEIRNVRLLTVTPDKELLIGYFRMGSSLRRGAEYHIQRIRSANSISEVNSDAVGGCDLTSQSVVLASQPLVFQGDCLIDMENGESKRLPQVHPYSCGDGCAGKILAAVSAQRNYHDVQQRAGLFLIEQRTGAVNKLDLASSKLNVLSAPELDPEWDRINAIVADPAEPDWFYVAIGTPLHGGRLLRVSTQGKSELVFCKEVHQTSGLAGLPGADRWPADVRDTTMPVLSACNDGNGQILFVTFDGVYAISNKSSSRFLGAPAFEDVGGFWIATNIPNVILVLSSHADSQIAQTRFFSNVFICSYPE